MEKGTLVVLSIWIAYLCGLYGARGVCTGTNKGVLLFIVLLLVTAAMMVGVPCYLFPTSR